ncbi:MAG: hypothetical protein ACTHMS_21610 [Jatrophihabitans sp.]|uniref:hypothetical protein n=1 Tax=Jatrophihabitans sp. TaxID=1932789 RepID=UPI003F7E5FED
MSAALAGATQPPGGVSIIDPRNGHRLPADPLLHRGEQVIVQVDGFRPAAQVVVGLVGVRRLGTVTADASGTASYRFTVPEALARGRYALILSGPPAATSTAGRFTTPPGHDPTRALGDVRVTVPLDVDAGFRLGPRLGVSGVDSSSTPPPHGHSGRGGHGVDGQGTGGTSSTGVDSALLLALAAALVASGLVALRRGRRRRGRHLTG